MQREQIHVGDKKLLDRLDQYSSPRLVEYSDPDPQYAVELNKRHEQEAKTLASLPGWEMESIKARMGADAPRPPQPAPWWKKIWRQ